MSNTAALPTPLPSSATPSWIAWSGVVVLLTTLGLCAYFRVARDLTTGIAIASLFFSMAILELCFNKPWRRQSSGLDFQSRRLRSPRRVLQRYVGLLATLACCAFLYWLFPEYHGAFYDRYFEFLGILVPLCLILAVPYFYWLDAHLVELNDGFLQTFNFFLGRWNKVERKVLTQHALSWLVKAFFLALMYIYLGKNVKVLMQHLVQWGNFLNQDVLGAEFRTIFKRFFDTMWNLLFLIDLAFAAVGYSVSLRILDSHTRSTEPTMLGWAAALVVYQPFWSMFSSNYLRYDDDKVNWGGWLWDLPWLYVVWGSVVLALMMIYTSATVQFGLRFSNLTHRGIMSAGAYRLSKHPAYLSKGLSWWLVAVPFVTTAALGPFEVIRNCTLLFGLCCIYYLRARTEERHLSQDPDYIQYAMAMNERGVSRWINRFIPALRYRAPRDTVERRD